jgi:hypothetical protein
MALNIWIYHGRKSKAAALRKAGYGKSIYRKPHKFFNSTLIIRELELRGYDRRGVRAEVEAVDLGEVEAITKPLVSLPVFSTEALQALKEQLREVGGFPVAEERISYVPASTCVDICNAATEIKNYMDDSSFSSM